MSKITLDITATRRGQEIFSFKSKLSTSKNTESTGFIVVYLASEHLIPLVYCNVNNNNLAWHCQISLLTFSPGKKKNQTHIHTKIPKENNHPPPNCYIYLISIWNYTMQKYGL